MRRAYCWCCADEVDVVEGRCWTCVNVLGIPVFGGGGVDEQVVTVPAPSRGEGMVGAPDRVEAASRAPLPSSSSVRTKGAAWAP